MVSHRPAWAAARRTTTGADVVGRRTHLGEMVVATAYARDVVSVFEKLDASRWPIRWMRLVDAYDGDDDRSMAADNTSPQSCRAVVDSAEWSDHAYGTAVDLDPRGEPVPAG